MEILDQRDIIGAILSFIDDYATIRNILKASHRLRQYAQKSIRVIEDSKFIPYDTLIQFENLEQCSVKIQDPEQFSTLIEKLPRLKTLDVKFSHYNWHWTVIRLEQIVKKYGQIARASPRINSIEIRYWYKSVNEKKHTSTKYYLWLKNSTIKIDGGGGPYNYFFDYHTILNRYVPIKTIYLPDYIWNKEVTLKYLKTLWHLEEINISHHEHHWDIAQMMINQIIRISGDVVPSLIDAKPSASLKVLNLFICEQNLPEIMLLYPNLVEITIYRPKERCPKILEQYSQLKTIHICEFGFDVYDSSEYYKPPSESFTIIR